VSISWKLDSLEDEESLLGEIRISDSLGSAIVEDAAYLDSWFGAIGEGLQLLGSEGTVEIDLIEEPDPLIFRLIGDQVEVQYKNAVVRLGPQLEAIENFESSAAAFVEFLLSNFGNSVLECNPNLSLFQRASPS
jgi:hypothetical protein